VTQFPQIIIKCTQNIFQFPARKEDDKINTFPFGSHAYLKSVSTTNGKLSMKPYSIKLNQQETEIHFSARDSETENATPSFRELDRIADTPERVSIQTLNRLYRNTVSMIQNTVFMIQNTVFTIQKSVSMVQNYSCHGTERPYSGYRNPLYSIQDTEISYTEVQYSGNRNAVYRNTVSMKKIYSYHGTKIPYTGYRNTPYSYRIQKYPVWLQNTEVPYQSYELHATFSLKPFSKSNRKC